MDISDTHHPWFGKVFPCRCKVGEITTGVQDKIGSDYYDITLANFMTNNETTTEMLKTARAFVNNAIPTYCVYGSNGSGKTTILSAITNEFIKHGIQTLYVTAYDAMEYIKAGINHDFGTDERISKIISVPVLCMDELTQVRWTEYNQETLEAILDRRIRVSRSTAVAMDQDPDEVLSPRIASRFKLGAYIHIKGSDWRIKQGELNVRAAQRAAVMDRGRGER